jgi:signal peptidase I
MSELRLGNQRRSSVRPIGRRPVVDQSCRFRGAAAAAGEVVALRHPQNAGNVLVKRVVGLPGESVEIRHGDVYANGQIQRKDLAEQRALAVLVHDADYRATLDPAPPPRWQAERRESRWTAAGGKFHHAAGPPDEPVDWLVYHHGRRPGGSHYLESPVTDESGYSQSQPRRDEDIHAVADMMLSLRIRCGPGRGTVCIRAADGRDTLEVRLLSGGNRLYQVYRNGTLLSPSSTRVTQNREEEPVGGFTKHGFLSSVPVASSRAIAGQHEIPLAVPAEREELVEASLVDQQFLLALDGTTVFVCRCARSAPLAAPPATPLAIGVQAVEATVSQLRVYRDVYYTSPTPGGRDRTEPVRLAADQYFVLGDNSPVSEDSRHWPNRGAVEAKLLIGKPFVAIPSAIVSPWRGWQFQVPNLARIRYIQ